MRVGTAVLLCAALLLLSLADLASASGECTGCGQDFDCPSDGCPDDCDSEMFKCIGTFANRTLKCEHVGIFEGNIGRDVGLLLILPVFLALASAGGIGGGGIVIPILLMLGDFPPYYSVPLSVTSIVGVSIVCFAIQIQRKHPNERVGHRPLIAFDVVLLLLPMALAGTVLGVLLNGVSPNWLVLAIIFIVLSFSSVKTVKKGLELMRKERNKTLLSKDSAVSVNPTSRAVEMRMPTSGSPDHPLAYSLSDSDDEDSDSADSDATLIHGYPGLRQQIREEEEKFPWIYIGITFSELAGLIVLNLIKGGKGSSIVNVECGTGAYWAVTAATFVYLIGCALFGMWFVKRKYKRKVAAKYKFVEGDIDFSGKTVYVYPIYAILAGLLAGFLGIGGGMIIGPLLLEFGMIPMVSSPTSAYMTLFTSISSTTQFLVLNRIPWDYGVALFLVGMVASLVGQLQLMDYVKRTGKNSLIAFMIAFIIIFATILLSITGALQIKSDAEAGKTWGFTALC